MRVLITGGSGLIGIALSVGLVSHGHEVIVLRRSPERATGLQDGAQSEVAWFGHPAEEMSGPNGTMRVFQPTCIPAFRHCSTTVLPLWLAAQKI